MDEQNKDQIHAENAQVEENALLQGAMLTHLKNRVMALNTHLRILQDELDELRTVKRTEQEDSADPSE